MNRAIEPFDYWLPKRSSKDPEIDTAGILIEGTRWRIRSWLLITNRDDKHVRSTKHFDFFFLKFPVRFGKEFKCFQWKNRGSFRCVRRKRTAISRQELVKGRIVRETSRRNGIQADSPFVSRLDQRGRIERALETGDARGRTRGMEVEWNTCFHAISRRSVFAENATWRGVEKRRTIRECELAVRARVSIIHREISRSSRVFRSALAIQRCSPPIYQATRLQARFSKRIFVEKILHALILRVSR